MFVDLADCGWRSQPRVVPQGIARSNECYLNGVLKGSTTNECIDLNDHWAINDVQGGRVRDTVTTYTDGDADSTTIPTSPYRANGWFTISQCGLGTQTSACGERPIYIGESAPGGCEQTCVHGGRNFYPNYRFDPNTVCSDGGEGSVRVPFLMPDQVGRPLQGVPANWRHVAGAQAYPPLVYWCAATHCLHRARLTPSLRAQGLCLRIRFAVLSVWAPAA